MVARTGLRRQLRDRDRHQHGPVHGGKRRLREAARVHRDGRHDQHRLAARGIDQGLRLLPPAGGLDAGGGCRSGERLRRGRRGRGPRPPGPDQDVVDRGCPEIAYSRVEMKPANALLFGVAVLLAGTVIAAPPTALAKGSQARANSQTYIDSTGEDPSAPDITTIVVSNDDAGLITFKLNISNRPTLTADMLVLLFLDTDQKATTGDTSTFGADYAIELDPGQVGLFKWNGTDYIAPPSQSSVTFTYDATGATIRVSAPDLGHVKAFNFAAVAFSGLTSDSMGNPDFTNAHGDAAPDAGHGVFSYRVLTKFSLSVKAFTTGPKPAKAGKKFVASLAATE